jgi:uncharacterized membrane protein YfcA
MVFQPDILDSSLLKLSFVSLWLSFGITLFYIFIKEKADDTPPPDNGVTKAMKIQLILFGVIGGLITSLFGSGVDIIIFSLLLLRYEVDVRTATATSIVLMTILTIIGFLSHSFLLQDFGPQEYKLWIACVPIVLLGAPLGSFILSKISQKSIAIFLISILFIQYIGALFVLPLTFLTFGYSLLIIALGMVIFGAMRRRRV